MHSLRQRRKGDNRPGPLPRIDSRLAWIGRHFRCLTRRRSPNAAAARSPVNVTMLPNDSLNPVFEATVQATEEAIINAMVAAETMNGAHGSVATTLRHDQLRNVLRKYNRLAAPEAH